jgi:TetR/AcrR family fatty acid metabolism transcriptional regulator
MPRLTDQSRRLREDQLLAAARRSFADFGFEAASIAGIARGAGVSDGLLYRYFADKRALLLAVLARFFEELIDRAGAAVAAESGFAAQLRALTKTHFQTMVDDPSLCRLFLRQTRDAGDYLGSPIHDLTRRYAAVLTGIVRVGRAAGECRADLDDRLFRDLVFGGMEHIGWRFLDGDTRYDPREAAARLVAQLVEGCAP